MTQSWKDTYNILDFGFENFTLCKVIEKGEVNLGEINVLNSKNKSIPVSYVIKEDLSMLLSEEEKNSIEIKESYIKEINAPIEENIRVGEAVLYIQGEPLLVFDILTKEGAEIHDFISSLEDTLEEWLKLGFDVEKIDLRSKIYPF